MKQRQMGGRQRQAPIALRSRLVPLSAQLREPCLDIQGIRQQASVAKALGRRQIVLHLLVRLLDSSSVYQGVCGAIAGVGMPVKLVDSPCQLPHATTLLEHVVPAKREVVHRNRLGEHPQFEAGIVVRRGDRKSL
jgi:hypothetical protein